MKVIKKLKLNEIYQIDGGFFYIDKQKMHHHGKEPFYRYYLKTSVTPKKMDLLKAVLEGKTPCVQEASS